MMGDYEIPIFDPELELQNRKTEIAEKLILNPNLIQRELNNRSFYEFLLWAWPELSSHEFIDNWHIRYLCDILQEMVERVGNFQPKKYDLLVNIPPGSTKPVWEEMPVMMADGTWKKLKHIVEGDLVINKDGKPTKVLAVHIQGNQPSVNIKTFGGRELKLAIDHPVLTTDGWVNGGDIVKDQMLALMHRPEIKGTSDKKIHEFKLTGYMVGDGGVSQNNCSISGNNIHYLNDFLDCADKMGFDYSKSEYPNMTTIRLKARKDPNRKSNRGKYKGMGRGYRVVEGPRKWLRDIGLAGKTSKTKRVPDFVWKGTNEQIAAFLATYFNSDGTISCKHKGKRNIIVSSTTISKRLAYDLQKLYLRLGISMKVRKRVQNGYGYNKDLIDYTYYTVDTSDQDSASRFLERIPISDYKLEKIEKFAPQKRTFEQMYWPDKVHSVERIEDLPCRCLTVEDGHSFVVDGVVVHNTIICSIALPVWCWTKWYWMRFITSSYSSVLSLESADFSRDLIKSARFQEVYPELIIKTDKDSKSNYKIAIKEPSKISKRHFTEKIGGYRYSTSVGGTLTGYHGDVIIWDDPINPQQTYSDLQLVIANRWIDQTLPTRKTNKENTVTIGIMQRLHQNDPSGHLLNKKKSNLKHISIPGEIRNYKEFVKPRNLIKYYKDDLFDPNRLGWKVLEELETDLGQYGFAGQIGQNPTPAGGGMFKVDYFQMVSEVFHKKNYIRTVRYWDKSASTTKRSPYTTGVKMIRMRDGTFLIEDVKRGRWGSDERERIIKATAIADGVDVVVVVEQEPGSAGKDSADATIKNLAGFVVEKDRVSGDKVTRADPLSVQVNNGNVKMRIADWNGKFKEEFSLFPFSTFKDQVDASSGAFSYLTRKKTVRVLR